MIELRFKGWKPFFARKQQQVINKWLHGVARHGKRIFTAGMQGKHSGRIYNRRGRVHQASAPGEFPANDTGGLLASLRSSVTKDEATIGTNKYYSRFLREGTGKMARRRMSDDALLMGAKEARPMSRGWVSWARRK